MLNTATEGAERIAGFIPSISAWPRFGEMVDSAGETRLRTPIGPAARHTGAIAANRIRLATRYFRSDVGATLTNYIERIETAATIGIEQPSFRDAITCEVRNTSNEA